jgi:phage head maturation protease
MQHDRLLLREHATELATRDAIPRPASFNAEARTVEAVIASMTPVRRHDQRGSFLEILDPAGLDLAASRGASVLDSHQQHGLDNVLGTLDSVRVNSDEVIGLIRFSSRPEIAPILEDVRNGIIQHLSIGYTVEQWRDGTDDAGNRTRTATRWTINEASFVSVPADRSARTRGVGGHPVFPSAPRPSVNRAIRELCRRAAVPQHVVDELIDNERSIEDARDVVLDQLITRGGTRIMSAHNTITLDNSQVFVRAAGEALYCRVNAGHRPSGQAQQLVGLSCTELARSCLRRVGENTTAMGPDALITRSLHTTSDFPLILADVVGRTLREAYAAAPSGIRQLARQTTAQDFRLKHRLQLDALGIGLEEVTEAGEFRGGTMVEDEATYRVRTFGRIFPISRQALVNDDVGAFADLSRRLGHAAASFEAQQLVDLLEQNNGLGPVMRDTKNLFDADHGNVSGSGAAPSEDTLKAARLAMRKQTGLGGALIDVTPWAVLVPSDLETATEKVLSTVQAVKVDDVNPFASLRLIVEPRLASTARWYVTADPARADGLEYSYLSGSPQPQVETQAGFEVDGIKTRIRLDFGCGFIDFRSWFSNAGQ